MKLGSAALGIYVLPLSLLLGVIAWGLWRTPNELWGMYANQDGMWAAWNIEGILGWGRFLDLSPFNPLSGMGSLFLPNLPWLNPAAAALALPLPRSLAYLASYLLYGIEVFASIVILLRVIGLSPLRSAMGGLIHLLVLFPPLVAAFRGMSWYALAPVNAHLMAMANFAFAAFIVLGRNSRASRNALLGAAIVLCVAIGFVSAPVTFITYLPVYGAMAAAVLVWQWREIRARTWRLALLFLVPLTGWSAGVVDYLRGTAALSARSDTFPPAFVAGWKLLKPSFWGDAWLRFGLCDPYEAPLCPEPPVFYLHLLGLAGALVVLWRGRGLLRLLGGVFVVLVAVLELYAFAGHVSLFGAVHTIRPGFILWSMYTFFPLFLVCLLFAPADEFRAPQRTGLSIAVALLVPACAVLLWTMSIAPNQPPPPAHHPTVGLLGKSSVRTPVVGAVTRYLIEHASLDTGRPFRGYVMTYLGDPSGHVRSGVGYKGNGMAPDIYADARQYLNRHFGNRFQEMDFWQFGIPTLEEYGQWISKSAYGLIKGVFSGSQDKHNGNFLHAYRLDLDALAALGVRFVVTDVELELRGLSLRAKESAPVGSMYLYELAQPNLGTWSPTHLVRASSFAEAVSTFRSGAAGFADTAIVFDDVPGDFRKAESIELRMMRDGFRVTARSLGTSLAVLPIQFSRCFRSEAPAPAKMELWRVNAIQTMVKFSGDIDVVVRFDFSLLSAAQCRLDEAQELLRLGLG